MDGASRGTQPTSYTVWWGNTIRGQADASGLMYMRNRYYDPKTGRFTQQDPIGLAGGMNLYGFAGGDPVNYSDPFGLCPVCLIAWAAFEIGSGIYDIYNAVKTYRDARATPEQKSEMLYAAAAGALLPGGGYTKLVGKRAIRYADEIIEIGLRGRSLTSGSKTLRASGLVERVTNTGRHEIVDNAGRVRVAWDPANSQGGNHWHKFAHDGTPLNDAGRVVGKQETRAHIPSR